MSRGALGPLVLLLVYGGAFGWAAFGRGLLVFDDHPGQLYRVWHAVTLGPVPWRWNPGWWAGYAELQFYPPGFAYAAALLHAASLGTLSPEAVYRALLWVTLLLPPVSTYALLARVLGNGWLALPGGFLALVISAETRSGLEEGVRWGLVSARLGWGLLPALGLSLVGWLDGAARPGVSAPLLLAAVILLHPAHAPIACAAVLLAAALAPGGAEARARQAVLALALGVGLAAFWLLPLLAHLSLALPLTWGDASLRRVAGRLVDYPVLGAATAATAAAWAWHLRAAPADRKIAWLLSLAPAAVALVLADALLAVLRVHWLPVDRIADGLVLAVILGAPVALAAIARQAPAVPAWALAGAAIALLVVLAPGRHEPGLSLWPAARQWPLASEVVSGTRLEDLWRAIRTAPAGRILFVRSGVPLEYRPEWWRLHSHVTALAPVETGRAIIGGTFTHPSPVAGFVYTGSPVAPITLLAEQRDGVTLFGAPLAALRPARLQRIAEALRISAVVALDEDAPQLGALGAEAGFAPPRRIGPFLYFAALAPRPLPEAIGPGRLRVDAPRVASAAWRDTGIAYSPLWSAEAPGRGEIATRRGVMGLLEVDAAAAGEGPVELVYRPRAAEWAGVAVSAGAVVALLAAGWRRRPGRARAPGGQTSGS